MTQLLQKPPVCHKHGCEKKAYPRRNRKDGKGIQWQCPECNRQKSLLYARKNPEANQRRSAAWNNANPELARQNRQRRRELFPEKEKDYARRYRENNPEKHNARAARHRARLKNATVENEAVTPDSIQEQFKLFKGCAYCGDDKKLTMDHVAALADGGLHVNSNIVGACARCNCSKGSRKVEEWYLAQPFFDQTRWNKIVELIG